jgi:hypothetical protein
MCVKLLTHSFYYVRMALTQAGVVPTTPLSLPGDEGMDHGYVFCSSYVLKTEKINDIFQAVVPVYGTFLPKRFSIL